MTEPVTLGALLDRLVDARAEALFLSHHGTEWSAADFGRACRELAARFTRRGVGPGDRIVVYLEKCPEKAVALFAAGLLGAITVIANPRLKGDQLRFILDDSDARLVLTSGDKQKAFIDADDVFGSREILCVDSLVGLQEEPDSGADRQIAGPNITTLVGAKTPATILYTSGSTGMPKGIVQSHQNLCDGARIVAGYLGLQSGDHLLAILPLSFDYGLNQLLAAVYTGARITLLQFLGVGEVLRTISAEAVTVLAAVPTFWLEFAAVIGQARYEPELLRTLRIATNTGGRLPERVVLCFASHLPWVAFFSMYGLTEAFRSSFLPPEELRTRPSSIGKAIEGVELLVLDPVTGQELGPEEPGELVHCGALVALGYWNRPADTARVFRSHPVLGAAGGVAVFSGDLVRRDAEGFLYFVARGDQQIKVSGYRISPDEVSGVILQVKNVADAVVMGLEDGDRGQRIAACVAADAGLEAVIRRHCRAALPAYMQPAEYHFFDKLPQGPNRKVDTGALRAQIFKSD